MRSLHRFKPKDRVRLWAIDPIRFEIHARLKAPKGDVDKWYAVCRLRDYKNVFPCRERFMIREDGKLG
jgi:hypothetical protein